MEGLFRIFNQKVPLVFLLTRYLKTETRFDVLSWVSLTHENYSKRSKELNKKEFLNLSGILYPLLPTPIPKMAQKWADKSLKNKFIIKK